MTATAQRNRMTWPYQADTMSSITLYQPALVARAMIHAVMRNVPKYRAMPVNRCVMDAAIVMWNRQI